MAEKNEKEGIENESQYDRKRELIAFDETKAGVKGLVDAGIEKVPDIFKFGEFGVNGNTGTTLSHPLSIPLIDFEGVQTRPSRRSEIVQEVKDGLKKWGFFQVVNHGIPISLLDKMIRGVRSFHELDAKVKKEYYSRDLSLEGKKFVYLSNFDLYKAPATHWRDTIVFKMGNDPPGREEMPDVCRDTAIEYLKQVKQLGITIFELIAEAIGLKPSYFEDIGYAKQMITLGHYYPPCPEPELTMGVPTHTDSDFMTILLQDDNSGLQVLHEDQWVDIPPLHGGFIINVGDLLQLVSNDALYSVKHRVILTKRAGPRISVPSFFWAQNMMTDNSRTHGPIPELISEENPPVYRNISFKEYMDHIFGKDRYQTSALTLFKL